MFTKRPWAIRIGKLDGKTIIRLNNGVIRLDEANVEPLREAMHGLAEKLAAAEVLMDFGNIEWLTSTSLGVLLTFRSELLERGANLTLINVRPEVREILDVTQLSRHFGLAPQPEQPDSTPT